MGTVSGVPTFLGGGSVHIVCADLSAPCTNCWEYLSLQSTIMESWDELLFRALVGTLRESCWVTESLCGRVFGVEANDAMVITFENVKGSAIRQ